MSVHSEVEARQAELYRATTERKRVDDEAKLLANRIALLKQEEQRSWRAIQETRKRTEEIMKAKLRNYESLQAKEEARLKREEDERRRAENLKIQKESSIHRRALTQENRRRIVQNDAHNIKEAKKQWRESIVMKDHHYRQASLLTRQRLRIDSEDKRRKAQMLLEHKRAQAKSLLTQRIEEETRIREMKERELAEMEQLELQIIQRLQNTISQQP